MKRLLLILFCLRCAPAYAASIGDITTDFTNSGTATTADSTAKDHAAGNGILVFCSVGASTAETVTGVTNTAGDTFVGQAGAKRTGSVGTRSEWWYVLSTAGNASDVIRCTWSGNVSFPIIQTFEVIHTGSLSYDTASVSSGESAATSGPVASFSTAAAGVIFMGTQAEGGNTYTAPSSPAFTGTGDTAYGASYRITAGVESSITPATTWSASNGWSSVAVSITESGGTAGSGGLPLVGVGR